MKFLVLMAALIGSTSAFAGDKVGNGGGIWACMTPNQILIKGMLVDLYEAKTEFGLTPIVSAETNPINIVKEREGLVLSGLPGAYGRAWSSSLANVLGKLRMVEAELEKVDDALFRMRPLASTCKEGTWNYVQFANFTHLGHILVRQDLWNSPVISNVDKAALIWHEAIYAWLRATSGDKDSVRARQVVGIIFSQLTPKEMVAAIDLVLRQQQEPPPPPPPVSRTQWICQIPNQMIWKWFAGYADSEMEASTISRNACMNSSYDAHCMEHRLACDSFRELDPQSKVCIVRNNYTARDFIGKGRSFVEANFNARFACQEGSPDAVHCSDIVTCR